MNYQALGNNVILDIPHECLYMSTGKDQPEIKKPRIDAVGIPLTVLSIGQNVSNVEEGDKVLLYQESVSIINLDGKDVILISDFNIDIKLKGADFDIDKEIRGLQLDSDNLTDK